MYTLIIKSPGIPKPLVKMSFRERQTINQAAVSLCDAYKTIHPDEAQEIGQYELLINSRKIMTIPLRAMTISFEEA